MKKTFSKKDMIKLQNILRKHKKTITCAESCTGGLVASLITSISGSSDIFAGSIVSYSNEIKQKELKVKAKTLKKYGAVSKKVVSQMLKEVLIKFDSDFAIAISGIAGPNGGTKNKPVGTVIIGISDKKNKQIVKKYRFKGTRKEVQIQASHKALKEILKFIKKTLDK